MATEKRLIDANAFKIFLEEIRQDYREEDTFSSGFAACLIETVQDEYLALAPTVDAVEVVHGRWIMKQEPITWCEDDVDVFWECSICQCRNFGESPYCPNCGAKMDGDGNGE